MGFNPAVPPPPPHFFMSPPTNSVTPVKSMSNISQASSNSSTRVGCSSFEITVLQPPLLPLRFIEGGKTPPNNETKESQSLEDRLENLFGTPQKEDTPVKEEPATPRSVAHREHRNDDELEDMDVEVDSDESEKKPLTEEEIEKEYLMKRVSVMTGATATCTFLGASCEGSRSSGSFESTC